ncbi:ERF family protein, partial [Bacillus cereus]
MNIYQKLIEVRKAVPYLKKGNKGEQYSYTSSSQVVAAIREKMDELGLLLIPRIIDKNVRTETVEFKDKNGNVNKKTTTYFTELTMEFKWINAE